MCKRSNHLGTRTLTKLSRPKHIPACRSELSNTFRSNVFGHGFIFNQQFFYKNNNTKTTTLMGFDTIEINLVLIHFSSIYEVGTFNYLAFFEFYFSHHSITPAMPEINQTRLISIASKPIKIMVVVVVFVVFFCSNTLVPKMFGQKNLGQKIFDNNFLG